MKKILSFLLFWGFLSQCQSPQEDATQVCCAVNDATTSLVSMSHDKSFVQSHDEPLPIKFEPQLGENITFSTADGKDGKGFMIKSKKKSNKFLFVFHEWWGLNDYIKQEAEKLAKDLNTNVLAIDLYDGGVASTREDAAKLMQGVKKERAASIVEGAVKYAGAKARIATIGWCFGGAWSLQASLLAQKQAVACVIYYGMPEKDKTRLQTLNAPVLGIFAGKEKWINKEVVGEFENNLKELKKTVTIKIFDAEHAFANPSNPNFNKDFTAEAYQMSLSFLKKNL